MRRRSGYTSCNPSSYFWYAPFSRFPPWVKNEPSAIFDADYILFFWCFITTFFGYEDMLLATRHQLFQKGTMEVRVLPLQISFPVTISHHNQIKNTSHSTHGFHSAFKWQVLVYLLCVCFQSAHSGSQPTENCITIFSILFMYDWQEMPSCIKYNKNKKVI